MNSGGFVTLHIIVNKLVFLLDCKLKCDNEYVCCWVGLKIE